MKPQIINGFEIIRHGKVSDTYISAAIKAVEMSFKMYEFSGDKPRIEISENYVIFNGKKCPALYDPAIPQRIILGLRGIREKSIKGVPLEIAVASFAAHDATHHMQETLYPSEIKEVYVESVDQSEDVKNHEFELEANAVAYRVIKDLYGINISFTDFRKGK
jgi:hypothetical protein